MTGAAEYSVHSKPACSVPNTSWTFQDQCFHSVNHWGRWKHWLMLMQHISVIKVCVLLLESPLIATQPNLACFIESKTYCTSQKVVRSLWISHGNRNMWGIHTLILCCQKFKWRQCCLFWISVFLPLSYLPVSKWLLLFYSVNNQVLLSLISTVYIQRMSPVLISRVIPGVSCSPYGRGFSRQRSDSVHQAVPHLLFCSHAKRNQISKWKLQIFFLYCGASVMETLAQGAISVSYTKCTNVYKKRKVNNT